MALKPIEITYGNLRSKKKCSNIKKNPHSHFKDKIYCLLLAPAEADDFLVLREKNFFILLLWPILGIFVFRSNI